MLCITCYRKEGSEAMLFITRNLIKAIPGINCFV
jgi:hypothetical protein